MKVSFNMQGLLKKILSNNTFGCWSAEVSDTGFAQKLACKY
jgi:hypothetical protein